MSAPDWIAGDPSDLRRWRDARPEVVSPVLPPDVTIRALEREGEVPGGLIFEPPQPGETEIVYFHGGGFVVGSPHTHRLIAAWIAHLTAARVVSFAYGLGPEHHLPAQIDDARAAIRSRLSAAPHVRLAGDSAGAMVALWGYAALDPAERQRIADVLLNYPTAGIVPPEGPNDAALEIDGLGRRSIAAMFERIDPRRTMPGNPRLDPLAPGFVFPPRLTIVGAAEDPLLIDALALSSAAKSAGSDVALLTAERQQHGFLSNLPDEPALGLLRQALGAGGP